MIKTVAPLGTGALQDEKQAWPQVNGMSETLDPHRIERKAKLIKIACDIAAVAKSYQKIHHTLFGFSARKILQAVKPEKLRDLAALEVELSSIGKESKRIQCTLTETDFNDLPKRAKTIIAIHDALLNYAEAVTGAAGQLSAICGNLRREHDGETAFAHYSADQLRQDKVVYDASVQEFRRCGTRLTELFKKL